MLHRARVRGETVRRFFQSIVGGLEVFCRVAERWVLTWLATVAFLIGMFSIRDSQAGGVWIAVLTLLYCQTLLLSHISSPGPLLYGDGRRGRDDGHLGRSAAPAS